MYKLHNSYFVFFVICVFWGIWGFLYWTSKCLDAAVGLHSVFTPVICRTRARDLLISSHFGLTGAGLISTYWPKAGALPVMASPAFSKADAGRQTVAKLKTVAVE